MCVNEPRFNLVLPTLLLLLVRGVAAGLPTKAYVAVDDVKPDGTEKAQKSFTHVPSEIGALEAEEIGVEHLLRDVKDSSVSTLTGSPALSPYLFSFVFCVVRCEFDSLSLCSLLSSTSGSSIQNHGDEGSTRTIERHTCLPRRCRLRL